MSDAKNHILDRSRVIVPEGTMEDFKRPNHTDFMDSSELKKVQFSGLRRNELAQTSEIWVLGDVVASISDHELRMNPQAVNIAMQEFFGLHRVMPDTEAILQHDGVKRR